jgi:hypothetical protein
MRKKMSHRLALLIIAIAALPAACKTAGSPADTNPTGEYSLISIDGNELPYAPTHEGQTVPEVVSGSLTLSASGTFASFMQYGNPSGETTTRGFSGTYKAEDEIYILKWQGAGTTLAMIEDRTLTMNNEGIVFVYEK